MNRLSMQIAFIDEIEKLKTIKRQNLTLDQGRAENSAEHSWHLAVMAIVLQEYAISDDIDIFKVIKMLLIHDLVELYDGDTFLYDDEAKLKAEKKEKRALEKLMNILPDDQEEEFKNIWYEFETRETNEALLANALDALQPILNHRLTGVNDYNPYHLTVERILEKKQVIKRYTPKLWVIVEEAMKESVERGLYLDK